MFSDALLTQPLIKDKFNEALDIMNRAVSSGMGSYGSVSENKHGNYRTPSLYKIYDNLSIFFSLRFNKK